MTNHKRKTTIGCSDHGTDQIVRMKTTLEKKDEYVEIILETQVDQKSI